jgi:hypothetical protein
MAADLGTHLGDLFSSAAGIFKEALPPIIAAVALVILLRSLREGILRIRRRSPRVQVTQFAWTGSGDGRDALWITALFRDHLKALRLDGLDPLPDRAPGGPLVEIVEGVGQGVSQNSDLGRSLGRLLRAALPDCSYEVWATLRPTGDDEGSISVQLVERRRGNRSLANLTTDAGPWEVVTRKAAMAVSGALYPQLSNRHKGPWSQWRKPVPADLLGKYQDALRHERENRLEQALGGFRAALEMDPLNPDLRLKVAMLEERLELHLDAWFTYRAIIDERARKLWRGPQRRVRLLALYRLAIHLWNPAVATQWVRLPDEADNAHQRDQLKIRTLLGTALTEDWFLAAELWRLRFGRGGDEQDRAFTPRDCAVTGSSGQLADALTEARYTEGRCSEQPESRRELIKPFLRAGEAGDAEERERLIREVLQVLSLRYLEELEDRMRRLVIVWATRRWPDRLRRRPPLRRWLRRREFYTPTVKASMVLVRCRIAAAVELRLEIAGETEQLEVVKGEHDALLRRWPIAIGGSRRPSHRWRRLRLWLAERHRKDAWVLRYNAACTIAGLLLLDSSILRDWTTASVSERTRDAVAQLESFAHLAPSGHVASMADWIVAGDHDLDGIYGMPEFQLWATHHLGLDVPEERPARVVDTDRFTVVVIKRGAEKLAGKWRERAGSGPVPAEKLIGWWREESEIWIGVDLVLRERQSWRERLKALEGLERWNEANGLDTVDLAHESWDAGNERLSLSEGFFTGFSTHVVANAPARVWVQERAGRVRGEQDDRLQAGSGASVRMSRDERAAAVKAAKTWSVLAEALETALNGKENDSLTQLDQWQQA